MSAATAGSDRNARAENAFFNVEGEAHDLFHMSQIAWGLLMTVKATETGPGRGSQLNILPWEFEQIQFAVSHTMHLASELEKAFQREFEGKKTT
ncbi:MAG: hypothetical protein JO136_06605 [Hyphomicrobiales bacterium]|nr:hypothetical protein [Hyphomicrobiales bacterium]MBV9907366.1 hypothetical protein [Hyphomicrobiales bacterium]